MASPQGTSGKAAVQSTNAAIALRTAATMLARNSDLRMLVTSIFVSLIAQGLGGEDSCGGGGWIERGQQ